MRENLQEKFKNRKIKKPNKLLATIVRFAFKKISKKRNVSFEYDQNYLGLEKEQAVYLFQHRSADDYIYVFSAINRIDVHVLCGMQNVFQKYFYTILKHLGVIAKFLYQPDVLATKQIFQAKKLGDSIAFSPEGIQSTSGSTHPINPATLKLLVKLGLPVVLVTVKGSYFTKTRYSKDLKKGKIVVKLSKLFDSNDLKTLPQNQLYDILLDKFRYNEFEDFKKENIEFIGSKPNIDGLDNIIYKCPCCNGENAFNIDNGVMTCKNCGFSVKMDNKYNLIPLNKDLPFNNIDEWFKWQRKIIKQEILSDDFCLSAKVKLATINPEKITDNYSIVYIGQGTITLTNKGLRYVGTKYDEQVELFFDAVSLFSLSISLLYEFDFYYKNEYVNFKLLENEKLMAKWMLASEEIHNLYDQAWAEASQKVYLC